MSYRRPRDLMKHNPGVKVAAATLGLVMLQACGDDSNLVWPLDPDAGSSSDTSSNVDSRTPQPPASTEPNDSTDLVTPTLDDNTTLPPGASSDPTPPGDTSSEPGTGTLPPSDVSSTGGPDTTLTDPPVEPTSDVTTTDAPNSDVPTTDAPNSDVPTTDAPNSNPATSETKTSDSPPGVTSDQSTDAPPGESTTDVTLPTSQPSETIDTRETIDSTLTDAGVDGGEPVLTCNDLSCENGVCVEADAGASCDCANGWTGFRCEISLETCGPTSCNSGLGGSCNDSSGSVQCSCFPGYTGPNCDVCEVNYQDNDNDGICAASCSGVTCQANASCSDSDGSADCSCDPGFQDNDNNGSCTEACSAAYCQANATCDDADGSADCSCDPGFQDNDNNGSCAPDCSDVTCQTHATCDDSDGLADCLCDAGYQDNDGDEVCAADCSLVLCPVDSTCSDALGTATCLCNSGYQDNDTDGTCTPACSPSSCNAANAGGTCDDSTGTLSCACNPGFLGDNCDVDLGEWSLVYSLDIPNVVNWEDAAAVNSAYAADHSTNTDGFTRVAYLLTLDGAYVWTAMDAFTVNKAQLGVPVDWVFDVSVTNLDVASNSDAVVDVTGATDGRLEFWHYSYNMGPDGTYDYRDLWASGTPDFYGSMQVHRTNAQTTLWAYNGWSRNVLTASDLGIGKRPTSYPDWTLAANAAAFTTKNLRIYVK